MLIDFCYDGEMPVKDQQCPVCKKNIDWDNDKSFIMEYRNPHMPMAGNLLFLHTTCFINTAGSTWAERLGFPIAKPKKGKK